MEIITSILQTPINTLLNIAGIAFIFLTLFEISKGTVQLRKGKTNFVPIIIGLIFLISGVFYKTGEQQTAEVTPEPAVISTPAVEYTATIEPTAVSTDTVLPGEPTSTPAPTFTPIPILDAGEDWLQGCISTVWKVYPESLDVTDKDGCYVNFVPNISVRDKRLQLSVIDKSISSDEPGSRGMFVAIPANVLIDLNIRLIDDVKTGEIWVGVFQEPDVNSQGVLVKVPPGSAVNSLFEVYEMPVNKRTYISTKFKKDTGDYSITFDVASGNTIVKFEKYTSARPVDIQSDADGTKWLFIGYNLVFGKSNTLDANFYNLVIAPR